MPFGTFKVALLGSAGAKSIGWLLSTGASTDSVTHGRGLAIDTDDDDKFIGLSNKTVLVITITLVYAY